MLKRSLLVVALACGCSTATLPVTARAPSVPRESARTLALEPELAVARANHERHTRHVARLAPPFSPSGLTRRVPESEPMTAFASTP